MTTSKLSIITINYNNAAGLQKTIESVVNQTFTDYEYIIIDGGSIDGSKEIIEKYADKITYWVSEKDSGIYNAMNKGIKQAKGEYCLFMNSGDWLCNRETFSQFIKQNPIAEIVYGNLIKVMANGSQEKDCGPCSSQITPTDMYFGTLNHQSTFIKKNLFEKYGHYNENYKIASDWAFFLKTITLNNEAVAYINEDISYYDMGGLSSNMKLKYEERDIELKNVLSAKVYKEYKQLSENRGKARVFDAIVKQKALWFMVRVYNKIFGNPLW